MGILDFLKPDVPDYTAAYAKIADEMAKSRKDIKSAVGTAEKIQEMNFQKNRQDLMPVFKITQNAMKELAAGSKSGRWNLGKLTLKNVESFEDYVSRTGENTEVRTAFDQVQKFKENRQPFGRCRPEGTFPIHGGLCQYQVWPGASAFSKRRAVVGGGRHCRLQSGCRAS